MDNQGPPPEGQLGWAHRAALSSPQETASPTQHERRSMTTHQFFPLNGLRSATNALKSDLEKIKSLNAELNRKINGLDKSVLNATYLAQQTALLREDFGRQARAYLDSQRTVEHLAQIATQPVYWTVAAYLGRQMAPGDIGLEKDDETGNTNKLLRALLAQTAITNAVLGASRMSLDGVVAAADTAAANKDWPSLSAFYMELSGRAERGDDNARRAQTRLDQTQIPAVDEANALIAESQHTGELLHYRLQQLATGDTLGERMEGYQQQMSSLKPAA